MAVFQVIVWMVGRVIQKQVDTAALVTPTTLGPAANLLFWWMVGETLMMTSAEEDADMLKSFSEIFCIFVLSDWNGTGIPPVYFPFDTSDGISLINGAVLTISGKVRWAECLISSGWTVVTSKWNKSSCSWVSDSCFVTEWSGYINTKRHQPTCFIWGHVSRLHDAARYLCQWRLVFVLAPPSGLLWRRDSHFLRVSGRPFWILCPSRSCTICVRVLLTGKSDQWKSESCLHIFLKQRSCCRMCVFSRRTHLRSTNGQYYAYHGDLDHNMWKHIAVVFDRPSNRSKGYSNGEEKSDYGFYSRSVVSLGSGVLMAGKYYTGGNFDAVVCTGLTTFKDQFWLQCKNKTGFSQLQTGSDGIGEQYHWMCGHEFRSEEDL